MPPRLPIRWKHQPLILIYVGYRQPRFKNANEANEPSSRWAPKANSSPSLHWHHSLIPLRLPLTSLTSAQWLTSSKTFFNPLCVNAEHSTYFTAPNSLANLSPISCVIGFIFCLPNFSIWAGSSLKSTWVPTISAGTPGQWWAISGNHFSRTFSNDAGDVTEKQTRKTSVWGYESGRRRS